MWVRKDHAFEAIVDPVLFQKAQEVIALRAIPTDEEMLDRLRAFLRKNGKLSSKLMKASQGLSCAQAYAARFGSIAEAYRRIGFQPRRSLAHVERDRMLRSIRREFVTRAVEVLKSLGASIERHRGSSFFTINETLNVRLVLARCQSSKGVNRWRLGFATPLKPDVTIFARLSTGPRGVNNPLSRDG